MWAKKSLRIKLVFCQKSVYVHACGEGSCETEGKEEGKKIMQGRKRRLEKTSLPCSFLWATGERLWKN